MPKTKQFTFSFDDETAAQLKALADREALSMSAWMRQHVRQSYREQEQHVA
jgi:predicted transcriptional regulator